ncbi:hypothetical protein D3C72_2475860 [compost metagenome]
MPEKVKRLPWSSRLKLLMLFGKPHCFTTAGFQALIFSSIFRNTVVSVGLDRLLRPRPM